MSVIDRFPHSTAELRRVKAVQFGVLSPEEIVRPSAIAPDLAISSSPFNDSDREEKIGFARPLPDRAR